MFVAPPLHKGSASPSAKRQRLAFEQLPHGRAEKTAIVNCAFERDGRGGVFLSFGDNMFKEAAARFSSETATSTTHSSGWGTRILVAQVRQSRQPARRRVLRLQGTQDACFCGCLQTRAGHQCQEDRRQAQLVGDAAPSAEVSEARLPAANGGCRARSPSPCPGRFSCACSRKLRSPFRWGRRPPGPRGPTVPTARAWVTGHVEAAFGQGLQ